MASSSSNRHWPSMFRSKHAASRPWQPQPDMSNSPPSLVSGSTTTGCSLNPSPISGGSEERSSDPKPRWNPRPEQIRILEAIFNSGMVNPPRDEIPRIRMQLQEYGQVGDANVFYWFQNRKSRSKNKLRATAGRAAVARACAPAREAATPFTPSPPSSQQVQPQQLLVSPVAPTSSSSSSSDRSSGSSKSVKPAAQAMSVTAATDLLSPLAAACHQQMHYQGQPVAPAPAPAPNKVQELVATDEAVFLQWPQGHCLSAAELAAILGAQYMNVPVQQPLAASPAGMFLGLCNEVAAGSNITGHRSSTGLGQYWSSGADQLVLGKSSAGLGQYWSSGADQLVLGKSSAASNTAVAREEAHEDATKLGLLQYGFGVSAPALDATSAASAPDAVVSVASLAASTIANGAVANNQLQGLADAVFAGAAAAAAAAGTVAVARGAAVVCIAGTSAVYSFPATHLDVTTMFGEAAVLFRYNGEAVLVDEFGVTVEPLQQGALYCVLI